MNYVLILYGFHALLKLEHFRFLEIPGYTPRTEDSGACPGIRKGGAHQHLKAFFFAFQYFRGGAQLRK